MLDLCQMISGLHSVMWRLETCDVRRNKNKYQDFKISVGADREAEAAAAF